ncbi:MAG: DUF5615 family PIN-like protein [Bryobacteraceae bacterium]
MNRIRFYSDEDATQKALVVALRARRVDVLTALDCNLIARSDEDQLRHASGDGRVLYRFNIRDFSLLHAHWLAAGYPHAGIVLGFQQRYLVGEQLRRLLHPVNRVPSADMISRLENLSTWGR